MAEVIIMPKLGFNMSVGKLVKWYKEEGDQVTKGEPVFAVETDKTSIDIEATQDGVFRKKFIEEGDSVDVTLPIAIVADENETLILNEEETSGVKWIDILEYKKYVTEPDMYPIYDKIINRVKKND